MSIHRLNWIIRLLACVYSVNAFSSVDADNDLWGHLKFGEAIWLGGEIPRTDTYSYTASGNRWINHEWLAEVFFYLTYRAFGSTGLLAFKLALGLAIVHALSRFYFSRTPHAGIYALYILILTPVLAKGFAIRPQIFTFGFITAQVLLLYRFFEGSARALWLIPPIMLAWANTHGGVVAGLAMLGAVTAVECLRFRSGGKAAPLLACLGVSGLAVLINPYGLDLWRFFLNTIPQSREITEWAGVGWLDGNFLCFKLLVILFAVSLFDSLEKKPWELVMAGFAIFFAFRHERHTVLAGLILTPYLLNHLTHWIRRATPPGKEGFVLPWPAVSATLLILLTAVQAGALFLKFREADFRVRVDPRKYPVYAVRFMNENGIHGNVLTPFDWGEYLIWKLPGSKVSVDGRFWTVYPNDTFLKNLIFNNGGSGWQYVPDLLPGTDIILSDRKNSGIESLAGWIKIYEDPVSAILVKNTDPPPEALKAFRESGLKVNPSPPSWWFP